jgi:Lantibiotic dehydratase, N terminus
MSALPEHLMALPGSTWALWRAVVLRGTGFPARQVLTLASPASVEAAGRVLCCEEKLDAARAAALQAVHQALDRLRQEGLWQNRELRRPLLKAMQALTEQRLPKDATPAPSCCAAFAALRARSAELAAAQADFATVHQRETARISAEIAAIAREDLFREAVLWQNRHAVETALDELAAQPPDAAARTSRRRQHEELVASYLQRYCTKNDTIGFFGPVAFAQLADESEAVSVRCGTGLVQHREVYFETWCIEALTATLGRNPALLPWLAPRLKSSFYLEGSTLHRPFGKPLVLTQPQARLLALCHGQRIARDLARDLIADPAVPLATEEEVYRLIAELCKLRVLTWVLQVPPELHPDRVLAAMLARIEAEPLRIAAMAALQELQQARDRVALAAGRPAALDMALRHFESTFVRLTGAPHRHRLGQTYAARGLLYEDCRRDIEVTFGPELARRLGPPLSLMLRSARWLAGELTRRLEIQLLALHAQLSRLVGSGAVDCHAFFTSALSAIFLHRERSSALAEVERELQDRWARLLGPLPTAARRVRFAVGELADRFAAVFADTRPAWTLTHYFSPDVMIAAAGEAAFRRGEFELVLGEVHSGNTLLWSCFLSQHPDPGQVARALEVDTGSAIVVVPQLLQQGWPRRVSQGLVLPHWYQFHFADDAPSGPEARRLPAGALVIEEIAGGLRGRTRDGRVSFNPVDLFGTYLVRECSDLIAAFLPPAQHVSRVNFDDVIIARERWHFAAGELEFTSIKSPGERFLALRRWAGALGLPRFCFFKVATERKPCYLDLESPISGDLFSRFVRVAGQSGSDVRVTISEMAPGPDQIWLRDAKDNLYTCELRFAALDHGV